MNMEQELIIKGIDFLVKSGFPFVDEINIFTDKTYSEIFMKLLLSTKKNLSHKKDIVVACDFLLTKIKNS